MAKIKVYSIRVIVALLACVLFWKRVSIFPTSTIVCIWVFETTISLFETRNKLNCIAAKFYDNNLSIATYICFRIALLQELFYFLE